ncbi:darcynin family protein [Arsenicicoccus sp. oral taxon 190]|uniref:darcynin family protein n=1 Tax=Arsenicicoccus sp. oral taxon 190 TaxID=1658671 RepID=UPI00067A0B86|nr:darcynin family protein [Arsenicicoccus sp. oral taxon 190]AKT52061.1 hypothetical protein ADJ73_13640 [Arsenicicoccus sp. oral taxon 190]
MSSLHLVAVVQLTALPVWLALSRAQRRDVIAAQVQPALSAHADCSVRWLDAEAMTATCSDVVLVETDDLRSWHHLWEALRDSALFAVPYFRLESLVVGAEDAYEDHERTLEDAGHDQGRPA